MSKKKRLPEGWHKLNGNWCYIRGHQPLTGWQQLKWQGGIDWFYFDDKGAMQTGWQNVKLSDKKGWFYFDKANGFLYRHRWIHSHSKWFFASDTGIILRGVAVRSMDGKSVWILGRDGAVKGHMPLIK